MDRLNRFIKAVEYLKTKAEEPTNESVAKLLRYKSLNYISDIIGGSKEISPFVLERMVEFSINKDWVESGIGEMLNKPKFTLPQNEDPRKVILESSHVRITLQDYIDLLKAMNYKEEERSKELLSIIKELASGQKAIGDALIPIKEKTEELLSNSNTTLDRLSLVETIIRSDDTVIMNNQDRQNGSEVGTSAKEAGSRQLAADKMRKGKGSQVDAHKPRT